MSEMKNSGGFLFSQRHVLKQRHTQHFVEITHRHPLKAEEQVWSSTQL